MRKIKWGKGGNIAEVIEDGKDVKIIGYMDDDWDAWYGEDRKARTEENMWIYHKIEISPTLEEWEIHRGWMHNKPVKVEITIKKVKQ